MKTVYQAKPITVIAWQYTKKSTSEEDFDKWAENCLPIDNRNVYVENWMNGLSIEKKGSFVIENWSASEYFCLDKTNWFLYNTCTKTFEVLTDEEFKKLYE